MADDSKGALAGEIVDIVFALDAKGRLQDVSPSALSVFGYSREEIIGRHFSELVHPDDLQGLLESFERTKSGALEPSTFRIFDRSGAVHDVRSTSRARVVNGRVEGTDGVLLDLTGYRRAREVSRAALEALRESEARFRSLLDSVSEVVWAGTPDGRRLHYLSKSAREVYGRPVEHFLANPSLWLEVVHPEDRGRVRDHAQRLLDEGHVEDVYRIVRPDGSVRWLNDRKTLVVDEEGRPSQIGGIAADITSRVRAEQALKESEARTRAIYEHLPNAVFLWQRRADGVALIDVNEAARSSFPGPLGDLVGRPLSELKLPLPNLARDLSRCLEERTTIRREAECPFSEGESPRQMMLTYCYVPEDMVVLHAEDVTEQRRTEEHLRMSQRLEAVGRLAGGVAHDFNNLLSVILGYADYVAAELRPSDPILADVVEIQRAGERAAAMTRQLLAFSRKQILEPQVLDLNRVISEIEGMLGRLLGEDIELVVLPARRLACVSADPGQLEQVILNLAVNARDAMPRGGRLTIRTANVEIDEDFAKRHRGVEPGPHVVLSVSDTGVGMDAETRARAFEPFFTTKEAGQGTGLGLSTVYGIVTQSGGTIRVESEPGRGSTFEVYLPQVSDSEAEATRRRPTPAVSRGTETVLLVEDEDAVRRLAGRILGSAGYTVHTAASGGDALVLWERLADQVDLLLTDVVMPTMSGRELAERLLATRPDLKVLFMSGYAEEALARQGVAVPGARLVRKPFSTEELTREVRAILDERAA